MGVKYHKIMYLFIFYVDINMYVVIGQWCDGVGLCYQLRVNLSGNPWLAACLLVPYCWQQG